MDLSEDVDRTSGESVTAVTAADFCFISDHSVNVLHATSGGHVPSTVPS